MSEVEMLRELYEMIQDDLIFDDTCRHLEPSDTKEFCRVCFIINLYLNTSEDETQFFEETTEAQRETIEILWQQHCNS